MSTRMHVPLESFPSNEPETHLRADNRTPPTPFGMDGVLCVVASALRGRSDLRNARLGVAFKRELRVVAFALDVNHNDVAGVDVAEQDLLGQLVLDFALDGAAQRPGTHRGIVTTRGQENLGGGRE